MAKPRSTNGRLRRVMLAAGVAMFLVYTDFFAVQVALPEMAHDLRTTVTGLQWVISGYLLSLASFFVVGGRLADIQGRKTWLLIGVAIFGLTSLLGGLAESAEFLIAMRVVQGIGGAIIMPAATSVVTNAFPTARVHRAVGIAIGIGAIGQASGPLIGGLLTQFISWRWVLLINVPIAVIVVLLVLSSVEQSTDESAGRRIDWFGLLLVVASVATFTYGIDRTPDWGWTSAPALATILAGLGGLALFVYWQSRARVPLVDLSLFRIREFTVMVAAGAAGNIGACVAVFLSVIYLQAEQGLSPLNSAFAFVIMSGGFSASAQVAGRLQHAKPWVVMAASLLVGGLGAMGMGLLTFSLTAYLVASLFTGLGLGMSWAFANVVTQAVVPPKKAGAASGVVLTVVVGLGGVGVAAAASLTSGSEALGLAESRMLTIVLLVVGGFSVLYAAVVALFGREKSGGETEPTRAC